jgi:hypothetical protein
MGLYEDFDDALAVVSNITFAMPPVSKILSCQTLIRLHV